MSDILTLRRKVIPSTADTIAGNYTPTGQPPINMAIATLLVTTNVTLNTIDTNNGVIPAPGVGVRVRIWTAHLGSLPNRTGVLWAAIEDQTSAAVLMELTAPAVGNDFLWVPGGILVGSNHAVRVRESSNVASQSFRLVIYYTLEAG